MAATYDYDLFVIGAGSGGVRASRIAAGYKGTRVAVAEDWNLGGTCVNVGCVPKKLFVYGSHYGHDFEDARAFGWNSNVESVDWPRLIDNKNKEITRLNGVYQRLLEGAGVKILRGHAKLLDAHTVQVGDDKYTADKILVATGSWPYKPDISGIEHCITSNEAFYLPELPKRAVIIGGGYIAVEFANIFNGYRVPEVTLVVRGDEVLRGFDDDVRTHLHEQMTKHGINILTQRNIKSVEKRDNGLLVTLSDGKTLEADVVLLATGRVPKTKDLGLEEAGVKMDKQGAIIVNEYSQSNVSNIYAVGDATNRINLTPVALHEGHCFADTVFGGKDRKPDHSDVASAVFSQPPIGTVGLSEHTATERYGADNVRIFKSSFKALKHTLSGRDERAFMKLVVRKSDDKVLGVHMCCDDAGEMIQGLAVAVKAGATKAVFDATIGVHPTAAEEFVTMRTPSSEQGKLSAFALQKGE